MHMENMQTSTGFCIQTSKIRLNIVVDNFSENASSLSCDLSVHSVQFACFSPTVPENAREVTL